jgi:hypothetical protein
MAGFSVMSLRQLKRVSAWGSLSLKLELLLVEESLSVESDREWKKEGLSGRCEIMRL